MGVKDLWSILSPVCERKSLWELQDKTVAIDLSCWVCDSQCITDNTTQPRMYLRNLFFRANCLLLLGAHPVFVLEGVAPELKHCTIEKRKNIRKQKVGTSQREASRKGNRSRLNSLLSKCQQLLSIMGLTCLWSPGEAEAFCAYLNHFNHVDGCITQDGDCFLYGAQTVYRNFTISASGGSSGSNTGFSIDVYKMSVIKDRLSLGRNELIAISLLCGCDYNEKGVSGVGKETVLKFLSGVKDKDVLKRLKRWRNDSYFNDLETQRSLVLKGMLCEICGHNGRKIKHTKSGCVDCGELKGCNKNPHFILSDPTIVAELNIRKRALEDSDFPSQEMIDEFLHQGLQYEGFTLDKTWKKPDLQAFVIFSCRLLGWTEQYAIEKFLPLVTRWQILELHRERNKASVSKFPFSPQYIVKKRVVRSVESYEIKWIDVEGVIGSTDADMLIVTIEPQNLFVKAYPKVVETFMSEINMKTKKRVPKKSGSKKTALKEKENLSQQMKLDKFFKFQLTDTIQNTHHVLKDHANVSDDICLPCIKRNATPLKSDNIKTVKILCESFSDMQLEHNELVNKIAIKGSTQRETGNEVSSYRCTHHKQNGNCENSDLERSVWWDDCSVCFQTDDVDDLSFIVESIVKNQVPKEHRRMPSKIVNRSSVNSKNFNICSLDESFDEFDNLANEEYVPLVDRITSQD